MLFWSPAEHYNIIQIYNALGQMQLIKAGLHQPLEGGWSIGEPKRHPFTFPKAKWTHGKCSQCFASSSNSTCQYLDFRSKVENQTAPCRQSNVSSILGNVYPSLTVQLFSFHRSRQSLRVPSFFLTRTTALAHELKLFPITPISTISWRCCFTSSKRWGGILLYLSLKG